MEEEKVGIDLGSDYNSDLEEIIDLRDWQENKPYLFKRLKRLWEKYTGEDLEDRVENEPLLYSEEAIQDHFREIAEESGCPENLLYYLDLEAMVRDEMYSGYLDVIDINGKTYYYFTY